jgi:hypothetical protein
MDTARVFPPVRLALGRGDLKQVRAARGACIVNLGGPVLVRQASALGDGAWCFPERRLEDGETLRVEHDAWLTLTALAEAELVCLVPPPSPWRRLLGGLRARFPGASGTPWGASL